MDINKEIEILRELKKATECLEDLNQDNEQLLKDVNSLITLKENEVLYSGWIKISEHHPHYLRNRQVITYSPNDHVKIDVKCVYNNGKGGSCFSKGWNKGEGVFAVTHWMPLPEHPNN